MSISSIVSHYRGEKSLREFAAEVSEKLPDPITYQTIKNWEDGAFKPSYYFMLAVAMHNDDWRREFALEILAILNDGMKPDAIRFDPLRDI
jgi:hypothetical protein